MSPNQKQLRADAERWAARLIIILGVLGGCFFGILRAPRIQVWFALAGVDPFALGPGMLIVATFAAIGGVLAWKATRAR